MRSHRLLIALALLTAASPSAAQEAPAYATSAVPARIAASRPPNTGWPKDLTPLPPYQFIPLRIERQGARVVAISTSQPFGPETEGRLYWVHISNDGGKQWRPYFTGLAVSVPYIFFSTSQVPMLGANTLDLEGELLKPIGDYIWDRTPIMVHIPLETIMADSDGDGVTDLLAQHLGLDGSPDAPLMLSATRAASCGPLTDEQQLLAAAVEVAGGRSPRDWSDPLLITGDPQRFACIATGHKTLVYRPGSAGADRLWTKSIPDFTLNAARDYAEGGGWHARLMDGKWQVTPPPAPLI